MKVDFQGVFTLANWCEQSYKLYSDSEVFEDREFFCINGLIEHFIKLFYYIDEVKKLCAKAFINKRFYFNKKIWHVISFSKAFNSYLCNQLRNALVSVNIFGMSRARSYKINKVYNRIGRKNLS